MNTDEAKDAILELCNQDIDIEWYEDGDEFHTWQIPETHLCKAGERKLEKILKDLYYAGFTDGYKTARKHKERDQQNGRLL